MKIVSSFDHLALVPGHSRQCMENLSFLTWFIIWSLGSASRILFFFPFFSGTTKDWGRPPFQAEFCFFFLAPLQVLRDLALSYVTTGNILLSVPLI